MSAAPLADAVVTLRPVGDLTIVTATDRKDELFAALDAGLDAADGIELDLGEVDELDTAGLQLLLALRREAAARQVPWRVRPVPIPIEAVLRRVGLGPDLAPTDVIQSDPNRESTDGR